LEEHEQKQGEQMSSRRVFIVIGIAAASVGLALPGGASAAARSGVTLHHYFGGGLVGAVYSQKPQRCASRRLVKLFRQTGKKPNPRRDTKVGEDKAAGRPPRDGGNGYAWEIRYHRAHPGHYYARIPAKSGCQADNSPTIHIAARPQTKISNWSANSPPRSASFDYTAVGGIVPYHFRCRLDDQQYRRCPKFGGPSGQEGGKFYKDLSAGRHVFRVFAIGDNGKEDKTSVKQAFRIKG
jgi:hypothetical protein